MSRIVPEAVVRAGVHGAERWGEIMEIELDHDGEGRNTLVV